LFVQKSKKRYYSENNLMNQQLKITGYSTALFSTWFFIEDYNLLFDAGDGVTSALLQKSRKIKHVFISHADRDHLTGLFQFNQLNARKGFPIIHYPADSGSFPAIQQFTQRFDPHVKGGVWLPIQDNQVFSLNNNLSVRSIKNGHVVAPNNKTKSLSFIVFSKKAKLKPEFQHLTGGEIQRLSKEKGKDFITNIITKDLIGYSGDTPIESDERWQNVDILIHEATFLSNDIHLNTKANKHSNLEDVLKMVASTNVKKLILSHFSSRYSKAEIDAAIFKFAKKYQIKIPIFRVLPGETSRDILNDEPVYFDSL
jgi:ribonuclease Z